MRILGIIFGFILRHENWCFFIFFLLFIGFVDSNSIWERHHVWESTDNLNQEINGYIQRYQEDSLKLAELKNNPRRVEQVARERYYMTRPNEDLFIIQEGESVPGQSFTDSKPVVKVSE